MRIAIILWFLLLNTFLEGAEPFPPKEFSVKYNPLQCRSLFTLESLKDQPFAKVFKEEESLSFSYKNLSDAILATARGAHLKAGISIELFGSDHNKLGTILRKKPLTSPATYQVLNPDQKILAEGTMNWLGTRLILCDPKNAHRVYASFSRPYFHLWGDYWYVNIEKTEGLDPSFIVMIAIIQTYIDRMNCELKNPIVD